MMPRSKNPQPNNAAASAPFSFWRIFTQPTSIFAPFLRAAYETVTSSCALVALMLWVVLFFNAADTTGQILDRKPKERFPCRIPIAWENVTDSCQYVDGVEPVYSKDAQQHVVDLSALQRTDFLVRPHEMIRVVGTQHGCVAAEEIEIWLSDGSGLMRKLNVAQTQDGRSIVAAPDYPTWTIARVRRPRDAQGCQGFKLYTCLLYTSPSPRDATLSRMPSSA